MYKKKKEEREKTSAVTCLRRSAPSSPGSGVSRRKCSCLLQRSRKWIVSSHTHTHTQRASGTGAITTTVFLAGLGDAGSIYRMTVSIFVPAGFHAEKKGKEKETVRVGKVRQSRTKTTTTTKKKKKKEEKKKETKKTFTTLSPMIREISGQIN